LRDTNLHRRRRGDGPVRIGQRYYGDGSG
jgi:hypothetical protein